MNQEINPASSPVSQPAPKSIPATAEKTNVNSKQESSKAKILLLAVHKDAAGEIMITPIDVEHDIDDQSAMTAMQMLKRKEANDVYIANQGMMKKALGSLYQIFDQRLYRTQFRNFENFCFSLFGTYRIADETVTKGMAKMMKLKAQLEGRA